MADNPKKGFNINVLAKPQAQLSLGTNTIYFYSTTTDGLALFDKISLNIDASTQFKDLLPSFASLVERQHFGEEMVPLPNEIAHQLADKELEAIAEIYIEIPEFNVVRTGEGEDTKAEVRQESEPAVSYAIRLMKALAEHHHRRDRKMLDSINDLLKPVKLGGNTLGSLLNEYESLTKLTVDTATQPATWIDSSHMHNMLEENSRRVQEYKEKLEMARLTGQMTAQSAKLLKDLAEAASEFLERFDKRSEKADKDTRHQLNIAVWSIVVSAILAAFALGISVASYIQDDKNNLTSYQWQKKALELQKAELKKREQNELELRDLRLELANLRKQSRTGPDNGRHKAPTH